NPSMRTLKLIEAVDASGQEIPGLDITMYCQVAGRLLGGLVAAREGDAFVHVASLDIEDDGSVVWRAQRAYYRADDDVHPDSYLFNVNAGVGCDRVALVGTPIQNS